MKLSKFFNYVLLATCLFESSIAMEREDEKVELGVYFNTLPPERIFEINKKLSFKDNLALAQTCSGWKEMIDAYFQYMIPSQDFRAEININIHPDLYHNYEGEISNFGCTPQSLCIFLPFQEGTSTAEATTWTQTAGWSIDGYTGQIQKLIPFNGEISWCCSVSHPQGIVLGGLNQPLSLLSLSGGTVEKKLAFSGIEEADGFGEYFPNFLCNTSNVVFIRSQNNQDVISCYSLNDANQRRVVTLPGRNSRAFNFEKKFLVMGGLPNSLQVINPELDTLIEKPITLPDEIMNENVMMLDLMSDRDSVLIHVQNFSLPNNPISYFAINNISSDQPITTPLSFLSQGYKAVGCYLKNNYIFSVSSLVDEQGSTGDTLDVSVAEKRGIFAIHDLNNQLMYKRFLPSIPSGTYFVGNTIFVTSFAEVAKAYREDAKCWGIDFANSPQNLSAFNIKKYLI